MYSNYKEDPFCMGLYNHILFPFHFFIHCIILFWIFISYWNKNIVVWAFKSQKNLREERKAIQIFNRNVKQKILLIKNEAPFSSSDNLLMNIEIELLSRFKTVKKSPNLHHCFSNTIVLTNAPHQHAFRDHWCRMVDCVTHTPYGTHNVKWKLLYIFFSNFIIS